MSRAGVALIAAACGLGVGACSPHTDVKLPSAATQTPRSALRAAAHRAATAACEDDLSLDGEHTIIAYRYAYDDRGRLVHATGSYTAGGPDDELDYAYDNLDHPTHYLEARGTAGTELEITETYDTLGDLVGYHYAGTHDVEAYAYAGFDDHGNATTEVATFGSGSAASSETIALAYDPLGRISRYVVDGGASATTYTYDDDEARTITVDTDGGAYHGVIEYDDRDHELSEEWGGSDPLAQRSETLYDWNGDQLERITYRQAAGGSGTGSGSAALATVEIDTLRYGCDP